MNLVSLRGCWKTEPETFGDGAVLCILEAWDPAGSCEVPVIMRAGTGQAIKGAEIWVIGRLVKHGQNLYVEATKMPEG